MRKFFQLCCILILAFVLYSISAVAFPHLMVIPEKQLPTPSPTPQPERRSEEPYHATIQYGRAETIKHNNGPLYSYIRYPQGGHSTDEVISNWAHDLYNNIYIEFQYIQESEPSAIGEINVHFDSYLVDNRYAGIFQNGEFSYSLSIPPEEVVKTFNIDLLNNTFLDTGDILDLSQSESILSLLKDRTSFEHPDTTAHLSFIDESWLHQIAIGDDGILVILEKNKYLPEQFKTLTVTLPYEYLESALLIRSEPPLTTTPTPANTPEPSGGTQSGTGDTGDQTDPSEDTDPPVYDVPPQGNIDPSKPIIALSFDDGPGIYTAQFLDLFEKYGVRATFCTIGNLVNTQTDALVRAVNMGCEVIGHSWDHKNMAKLSADAVRKQLTDTHDVIESVTGTSVAMFRPPYGAVSDTLKDVAADMGMAIIYWSVDPEDWNTNDSDSVFNAVMQAVKNGSIILSHEIYKSTLNAYTRIIPELLSRGYQIVTVSEMLQYKYGDLTPGHIYYDGYDG